MSSGNSEPDRSTTVLFLNTLHDGVKAADYEQWVREVDYPTARGIPSILTYRVVRIDGPLRAPVDLPCDYIEGVEVTDLGVYRRELETLPGRDEFVTRLRSFVSDAVAVTGTVID